MRDGLSESAVPHYAAHRERLRTRFLEAGEDALADYEILELVLFRAIPRRDAKPLAKALLARFGSFAEVIAAPAPRLREIDGLGEAAIAELKIVEAAARRLARGTLRSRKRLSSFSDVLDYCRTTMALAEREEFRILFLESAIASSPMKCRAAARSTTRRSIRAKSCAAPSNSLRPLSSWSTTTPPAIRRPPPPTFA
jgi:hypothetical protein